MAYTCTRGQFDVSLALTMVARDPETGEPTGATHHVTLGETTVAGAQISIPSVNSSVASRLSLRKSLGRLGKLVLRRP